MRARYNLLKKLCRNVSVLFITKDKSKCPLPGGTLNIGSSINTQHIAAIKNFLETRNISTCYFSYNQFDFLTEFTNCKNLVEIHDVMHLREAQFNKFGYDAPFKISKVEEIKSLQKYDKVLSLNIDEVKYLKENGLKNVCYLPPNLPFKNEFVSSSNGSFGLLGSMAKPNLDGFGCLDITITNSNKFILAGPISTNTEVLSKLGSSTSNLGIIKAPSSFYSSVDVVLSPIRFGGGLKIKVFEALSFGKPVLATQHSIDGFPDGIEDVVTVVDNIADWSLETINSAAKIPSLRIQDFFVSNFNEQLCELALLELL